MYRHQHDNIPNQQRSFQEPRSWEERESGWRSLRSETAPSHRYGPAGQAHDLPGATRYHPEQAGPAQAARRYDNPPYGQELTRRPGYAGQQGAYAGWQPQYQRQHERYLDDPYGDARAGGYERPLRAERGYDMGYGQQEPWEFAPSYGAMRMHERYNNPYGYAEPRESPYRPRMAFENIPERSFGDAERMRQESHFGRGPRNYQRSDERIREEVSDTLMADPYIDPSEIEVRVDDGEVTLKGEVRYRADKRLAQDLTERILGVRDVHTQLKIKRDDRPTPRREGSEGDGSARNPVGSQARESRFAGAAH